jgi:hypothetical protein
VAEVAPMEDPRVHLMDHGSAVARGVRPRE